ncbi:hypothetical protein AHN10_004867 [Salmonella enterica subsp. enterica]|nr:hypothetical protein [Salmonella enterica subsp. enterica serovar Virginia]EIE2769613.1 hypothetical protein [Salmonella enterica subsp. enterica serovar Rubislaw]
MALSDNPPLKRAVTHSERFFRFVVSAGLTAINGAQRAIQGFSVEDPKRIKQWIV